LPAGSDQPLAMALETLPGRVRSLFGENTEIMAWIFLANVSGFSAQQGSGADENHQSIPLFDLSNPEHRRALSEALKFLKESGFNGVHLDLEPFPSSDVGGMIQLLEDVQDALGPGFRRSVFAPKYVPSPPEGSIHPGYVWTKRRPYSRLARHCEQLVVPLYDYGELAQNPRMYRRRVLEASKGLMKPFGPRRRIWFALPSFHLTQQHGSAETASNAISALNQGRCQPNGLLFFVYTGEADDYQPARTVHFN